MLGFNTKECITTLSAAQVSHNMTVKVRHGLKALFEARLVSEAENVKTQM